MLDPITAVATATSTFNLIKKGIAWGQDLESMSKQLSKWYGAVSDFNYAEKELNETGGVTKLLTKGSIEQMALDITINKQKIREQEKELRILIQYSYGQRVYAQEQLTSLLSLGFESYVEKTFSSKQPEKPLFRVMSGPYLNKSEVNNARELLIKNNRQPLIYKKCTKT